MRQIWITRHGMPDVFEVREAPDPIPNTGEVRIKVSFSGVNFADVLARMGVYRDAPPPPTVIGYEVSGVIDSLGDDLDSDLLGKRVMALTRFGGYSDTICVPVNQVFVIPDDMSFEDAAALPVNAFTAYQMLIAFGRLNAGDKVLIHGAAGGVGWLAVQMTQILGATAYGTASPSKHEALYELGIAECIDYRNKDFVAEVNRLTDGHGVQLVLDPIGGDYWWKSYQALAPVGRLMLFGQAGMATGKTRNVFSMAQWIMQVPWLRFNPVRLIDDNKGIIGVNLGTLWDEAPRFAPWATEIIEWYSNGWLKPRIDNIYVFDEITKAHHRLQDRQNIGKVLLRPE